MYNASKHSKMPDMPSQRIYFSKFSGTGIPPDPYHWQAMHSDCALCNNYSSYSQSKALRYLCDHARFKKPSRKLPMGMMCFE